MMRGWCVLAAPLMLAAAPGPVPGVHCRIAVGSRPVMGGWAGTCRAGLADGLGAGRVHHPLGTGVFAGRARAGQADYGIIVLDDGGFTMVATTPEPERPYVDQAADTSEHAFRNSFAGAAAAAQAHHRAGNEASARYYRHLRVRLIDGQPE